MGTLWFRSINWWWNSLVWTQPCSLQELSIKWAWFCQYQVSVIVGKLIHSRIASELIIFCSSQVYHVTVACWWEVLLSLCPTCLWCKLTRQKLCCVMQITHLHLFLSFLVRVIVSFLLAVIEVFCTSVTKCQIYLFPAHDRSVHSYQSFSRYSLK